MGHYSECFENWGYSPDPHDNYERIKKQQKEIEALKQEVKELKQSVTMLLLEMKGDDEE